MSLDELVHLARDLADWRERQQAVGSDAGVGAAWDVELRAESGVDERAAVARVVLTPQHHMKSSAAAASVYTLVASQAWPWLVRSG